MLNTPVRVSDPLTELAARLRPKNFITHKAEVRYIPRLGFHGLFATAPLAAGEIMWVSFLYSEDCFLLTWDELQHKPEFNTFAYQIAPKLFSHSYRVERDRSNYFNHSCAPNTWYDDSRALRLSYFLDFVMPDWVELALPKFSDRLPQVRAYFEHALNHTNGKTAPDPLLAAAVPLVESALLNGEAIEFIIAMRPIATDEEITMDYGTFWSADNLPFECRCGASTCRHWLKGEDWRKLPREHCALYLRKGLVEPMPIPPALSVKRPGGVPQPGAFELAPQLKRRTR